MLAAEDVEAPRTEIERIDNNSMDEIRRTPGRDLELSCFCCDIINGRAHTDIICVANIEVAESIRNAGWGEKIAVESNSG